MDPEEKRDASTKDDDDGSSWLAKTTSSIMSSFKGKRAGSTESVEESEASPEDSIFFYKRRGIVMSDKEDRDKWVGTPLVIPGKICCVYKSGCGFNTTLGDYRMTPLQSLKRIGQGPLDHHLLTSHFTALRSIRNTRKFVSGKLVRVKSSESKTRRVSRFDLQGNPLVDVTKDMIDNGTVCSICGLDPTWAYITHSGATRAQVDYNSLLFSV